MKSKVIRKKLVECYDPMMPPNASYAGNPLDRDMQKFKMPDMIETDIEESTWSEYSIYRIYNNDAMIKITTETESKSADKIIGRMSACFAK